MPNEQKCPQCGATLPSGALEGLCPACLLRQGATDDTATQGGALPFQPPAVEEIARMFPQLQVMEFIGKGGMGAVYKARQPALDRVVALKILPPQAGRGTDFAERFNREARALAKLNHPNIVAVHEFGQVDGMPFFIMEFVDGLNLRQLERAGRLAPREALQIVPQICEALQFAHDEGIVHRDIKPENILLDKKGRVKIADFGIAKIMGTQGGVGSPLPVDGARGVTRPGDALTDHQAIGTPSYMAPEQKDEPQSVDHRADIFSLGVVFYEMLTGELPVGKFAPPSRRVEVDVRLDAVVLRALEKEPERRYQQASDVKTMVETIATAVEEQRGKQTLAVRSAKTPASTATELRTWSPFQSPQVREICAHMTDEEKSDCARRGMFWGIWCAVSVFAHIAAFNRIPPIETALMVVAEFVFVQFLAIAIWMRMQRQFLVSTAWARKQGIEAKKLKLFSLGITLTRVKDGVSVPNWPGVYEMLFLVLVCMGGAAILLWMVSGHVFQLWPALAIVVGLSMSVVAGRVVRGLGRGWKATVLWMLLVPTVIGGLLLAKALEGQRFAKGAFGMVHEVTIADGNLGSSFFNFDAGDYVAGPKDFDPASTSESDTQKLLPWLTAHNVDLFARREDGKPILAMSDLVIAVIGEDEFDRLNHFDQLKANAAWRSTVDAQNRPSMQSVTRGAYGGKTTAAFQTRFDVVGVLQVVGVTSDPPGVKVRYKLVESTRPVRAMTSVSGKSVTSASVEKWAPPGTNGPSFSDKVKKAVGQFSAPPPGVKVDPSKILTEAKELAAQGQFEESLQRHIWYHNHALEQDPAQSGVRLSFALQQWVELGRKYPKAMQALVEIRDSATAKFQTHEGSFTLFMEVHAINALLNENDATDALFQRIEKLDSTLARQCFFIIEDRLVRSGDYERCLKWIGDPGARFEIIKSTWNVTSRMGGRGQQYGVNNFVTKSCQLIEVLNGTGHDVEAEKIRSQALAVLDDARLRPGEITSVKTEGQKTTIAARFGWREELRVFAGTESQGWSLTTDLSNVTATVEASETIPLENGSTGCGFVIHAGAGTYNVAMAPGGVVPNGELVFRENGKISETNGVFTFADIRQTNGALVPLCVRIRGIVRVAVAAMQPGFGPVREVNLAGGENLTDCFLDMDTGRVLSAPKDLVDLLRSKGQLSDGMFQIAAMQDWLRSNKVDLVKRMWSKPSLQVKGIGTLTQTNASDFILVDGVADILAEKKVNPNTFDTVSAAEVVRFIERIEKAYREGYPTNQAMIFKVEPETITAIKTREGAIALVDIVENDPTTGKTRLRYKIVSPSQRGPTPPSASYRIAMLGKVQLAKSEAALVHLKAGIVQQEAALKAGGAETSELQAAKEKLEALDAELKRFAAAWDRYELVIERHKANGMTQAEFTRAQNEIGTAEVRLRVVQAAAEHEKGGDSFGPVMERLVPANNEMPYPWFDVDAGRPISSAGGDDQDAADFAGVAEPGHQGLSTADETGFGSIALEEEQWNAITPTQLIEKLKSATVDTIKAGEPLPRTYGFTTRAGGVGIIQIAGYSSNPRGLKIRYKLLQPKSSETALVPLKASGKLGPLVPASADGATWRIVAYVSKEDANELKFGQRVTFVVDALLNSTFKGRVVEIAELAKAQNSMKFIVVIDTNDTDPNFREGMLADVSFMTQ